MAKRSKLKTPSWILEGYNSFEEYKQAKGLKNKKIKKTFKIKECPKCKSQNVKIILTGREGKPVKDWRCEKCGWKGSNIEEKELTEEEFLECHDEKREKQNEQNNYKYKRPMDLKNE